MVFKVLVIQCENAKAWDPLSFFDMFRNSLKRNDDEEWNCVIMPNDEKIPDNIDSFDGVVITGSRFNIREDLPWQHDLFDFIRRASIQGYPRIYGGCFGCQAIAAALGGIVDYNPNKRFLLRAEDITTISPYFNEYLPQANPDKSSYNIIVSHGDCVIELPKDAIHLATSKSCVNEMYIVGSNKNILGCQSHPEFEYEYAIRDRIWKSVVEKNKRMSDDEAEYAMETFKHHTGKDSLDMIQIIKAFLHNDINSSLK